jgi:hypothetical protein
MVFGLGGVAHAGALLLLKKACAVGAWRRPERV